ncbi:hypothetical protein N8772_02575 [Rickettsiales bacterium]|nr:hypothetical protein [Rickettsiales bacterium]
MPSLASAHLSIKESTTGPFVRSLSYPTGTNNGSPSSHRRSSAPNISSGEGDIELDFLDKIVDILGRQESPEEAQEIRTFLHSKRSFSVALRDEIKKMLVLTSGPARILSGIMHMTITSDFLEEVQDSKLSPLALSTTLIILIKSSRQVYSTCKGRLPVQSAPDSNKDMSYVSSENGASSSGQQPDEPPYGNSFSSNGVRALKDLITRINSKDEAVLARIDEEAGEVFSRAAITCLVLSNLTPPIAKILTSSLKDTELSTDIMSSLRAGDEETQFDLVNFSLHAVMVFMIVAAGAICDKRNNQKDVARNEEEDEYIQKMAQIMRDERGIVDDIGEFLLYVSITYSASLLVAGYINEHALEKLDNESKLPNFVVESSLNLILAFASYYSQEPIIQGMSKVMEVPSEIFLFI